MVVGSIPVAVTETSDFAPALSKEFLDIQATIECRFTLKCVRDMIRTYSQMHRKINTHNTGRSFGFLTQVSFLLKKMPRYFLLTLIRPLY